MEWTVIEGIVTIKLARPDNTANDPGGILGWLYDNHYPLYFALWSMDKACDGLLFQDPDHTISWHLAMMAQAGNPFGIACCKALDLLSPNHCAWALSDQAIQMAKAGVAWPMVRATEGI